jgi:glutamate formiminotransferase/glutamate formiminotransferase/formiminotetrahydrofolate cyclodeaminase
VSRIFECVPNFSEGRDVRIISAIEHAIASVPGAFVLHRTSDADHNRSVITFAGGATAVVEAAVQAAAIARDSINLTTQQGVHPRLGALDVLPFVPLEGVTLDDCVTLAHRAGERLWHELGIPVYFYQAAARKPDRVLLEGVRRGQFEGLREQALLDPAKAPDLGGPALHATAGATIVGARKILIAYNINLKSSNLAIARQIARAIRTSSGGLPELKALGLPLESRGLVQVSMNLTDFERTPVHVVFNEVQRLAALQGVEIEESEIIGLIPRKALQMAFAHWLKLPAFESTNVIETLLEQVSK